MPSFVDLFCGAGGLSLGFKQAGWSSLLAVDHWPDALASYALNFSPEHLHTANQENLVERGHRTRLCDLSSPTDRAKLVSALDAAPEWIIGGPPCQGFSTVGRRDHDDPRNRLLEPFAALVDELKPRGFLLENVLGLKNMNRDNSVVQRFSGLGYTVSPLVLRAADFGVPQLRRRIVFVGVRSHAKFRGPPPTDAKPISVWQAISDLPALRPGEQATQYRRTAQTDYQRAMRTGSRGLQGHRASRHPPQLVQAISHIPDGGNRRDIPDNLQPKSGFHNSYARLDSARPAVAVTQNMGKPSGTRCIHPFQHRGLTAREGARLQSFPDWFHFVGGVVSQRTQIANAVPPRLGAALATALLDPRCWDRV